ncbi:MAG: VanZ family protein [Ruminococcus flavefaciens]|nr:VanZ family protein [Ruminococcus flavefaciens]
MKKYILIFLTVVMMVIIFFFSMENSHESSHRSAGLTEFILKHFIRDYQDMSDSEKIHFFKRAEHIIRKLAHFSVYTVLGFFASSAIGRRKLFSAGTLITIGIGFLYACSDELHQYFVPERSCRFTDVLIDTSGVIAGIIISMAVFRIYDWFKQKFSDSPL